MCRGQRQGVVVVHKLWHGMAVARTGPSRVMM